MIDVDQIRNDIIQVFDDIKLFEEFFKEIFNEIDDDIKNKDILAKGNIGRFRNLPLTYNQKLGLSFNRLFGVKIKDYKAEYGYTNSYIVKDYNNREVVEYECIIRNDIKIHMWKGFYHIQYQLFDYLLRVNSNLIIDGAFLREDFPLSKDIKSWTNQDLVMLRLMS